jgi:hypothetical protein
MRIMHLLCVALALIAPASAVAQVVSTSPPAPTLNQEGMRDFCIYANTVFSLGAQLCVPNSSAGMRCVASEGTKSDGRAFWSYDSKEWPNSPELKCGGR